MCAGKVACQLGVACVMPFVSPLLTIRVWTYLGSASCRQYRQEPWQQEWRTCASARAERSRALSLWETLLPRGDRKKGECVDPASLTEQLLVGEFALSVMVATETLQTEPRLWCTATRCMIGNGVYQSRGR